MSRLLYLVLLGFLLSCSNVQLSSSNGDFVSQDKNPVEQSNGLIKQTHNSNSTAVLPKEEINPKAFLPTPKICFPNIFKLLPRR